MADQTLTFHSWVRPSLSSLITAQAGGRAQAATSITLTEAGQDGAPGRTQTQSVAFLVAGPADVVALQPGAIVRRYPAPGVLDHESDRCPYVELADPTLPWRYTPAPTPTDAKLHPWLVLLVGLEGTELTLDGAKVKIDVSAQQDPQSVGAPASAYRFAHVQDGSGQRTTRLLSARPLDAGTDYLAVVVPAYDAAGSPSWTGAAAVTVPVYDFWRFRTAVPAGSFEDLAARLEPGDAPSTTGRAVLHYPRLQGAPDLEVFGALVGRTKDGIVEDPLPTNVKADMAALRLPARDPQGRPIVSLPRYGDAWSTTAPDQSIWGSALNGDPRHRGIAGLGLAVGIDKQENLVADVMANLGALHEARQRIRHLTLGLAASRSLWQRRMPTEPMDRLWVLGPSTSRLVTPDGTVNALATADDRTMPRGAFSAAARRILRAGPPRTALSTVKLAPADVVGSINREPPPIPGGIDGFALDKDALRIFDVLRKEAVETGRINTQPLLTTAIAMINSTAPALRDLTERIVRKMQELSQEGRPVPWGPVLAMVASADSAVVGQSRDQSNTIAALTRGMTRVFTTFPGATADDANLTDMLAALDPLEPDDPTLQPVDLGSLAAAVETAIDPSTNQPPAAARVLATIAGAVDPEQPLAPPEPCLGLDRPAWADLGDEFGEWLLPGIAQLPENSVIGLESDPIFVDAYLVGLNTQLLGELRWRNIPVATGCTLIRRFWDRADTSTGERADDIVGVASWTEASALGDPTHRAQGATGRELVIAVRGDLLLRYPTTLVYLQSAVPAGATAPNFDIDPDDVAVRVFPGFRGRIGADVSFFGFPAFDATALADHWLVFEEPPAGYRFANDVSTTATTGHEWAVAALAQPVRVLIRGDSLDIGGGS
jgi:hypothetical protein